jgi:hypothetical protein
MNIHYDWNEDRRAKSLEKDIRDGLKYGIRDEENRESRIVSSS